MIDLLTFMMGATLFASNVQDTLPVPVLTLPAVEVSRARALLDARRRLPTAFVTDLPAGVSNRAMESTAELLASTASVRIVQYGGLGAFSTVSLRGAPPGQVTVYLDGAPLTSAAHGVVDVSDLPSSMLERIEVYRGMSPLSLGAATPGGAVNLVTSDAGGVRSLRVATGSFGTAEARGTLAATRGPWAAFAHLGYQGSRGDFAYFDDNGTPQNPGDDSTSTRRNARFDAIATLARVGWKPRAGVRVTLLGDAFHKAQGMPGLGAVPALHPRLSFQRQRVSLESALAPLAAAPGLTLRGDVQRERSRFRDTEGELGLGRQETDERFRHGGVGGELATPAAWTRVLFSTGGSLRWERAEPSAITQGLPVPPPSTRITRSAFVTLRWLPLHDALTLHAGRRWNRQEDHLRSSGVGGAITARDGVRELDSPQLGTRLLLARGFEMRANWSRSQRAPDFLELFGNQGSVLGNPSLQPERGGTGNPCVIADGSARSHRSDPPVLKRTRVHAA
ncbi:MAG: TonB-dependent receptor, partial [Candidatus Eisenbacteria bacterium]